jgi:hypothetical protein
MDDREDIYRELIKLVCMEGCSLTCEEGSLFKDEEGWKFMLDGFMEPWKLGHTVAEAKASIREYANIGFGMI